MIWREWINYEAEDKKRFEEKILDCYGIVDSNLEIKLSFLARDFSPHHALKIATKKIQVLKLRKRQILKWTKIFHSIFTWWQGASEDYNYSRTKATANSHPHITLNPFRGRADANWSTFASLLRSLISVGTIPNANWPQFLQLHLLDLALLYFRTLPQETRNDFDAAIFALKSP